MASTTLSNVNFLSQPFKDNLFGEFTSQVSFLTSGVLAPAPEEVVSINEKGYTVAIPKWNVLSGDSAQITDSSSTSVNSLGDIKDVGIWIEREKAWGADEMISVVAGKDVTAEIARQLGMYWARELHRVAGLVRTGVFTTALASTHSTGATYSGATINVDGVLAAKQLLGDNKELLTDTFWHSKVQNDAVRTGVATYDTDTRELYKGGKILSLLGTRPHLQDATLEPTADVYPTYIAAQRSMIYKLRNRTANQFTDRNVFRISSAEAGMSIDVELNREAKTAGGQDELISRVSMLVHIPGVAWNTGGGVTSNPTDAQMLTGSNWTKVQTDNKLIRMVQLKTL